MNSEITGKLIVFISLLCYGGKMGRDKPAFVFCDLSSTFTSSTSTQASSTNNEDGDYDFPPEHMTKSKLRQMLAALSFENVVRIPRKRLNKKNKTMMRVDKKNKTMMRVDRCGETEEAACNTTSAKSPSVYGCTVDPESSDDVFFDAAMSERDIPPISRDSVVLPSIVVHRGGFETVLDSPRYETQLYQQDRSLKVTIHSSSESSEATYDDSDYEMSEGYSDDDYEDNLTGVLEGDNNKHGLVTSNSTSPCSASDKTQQPPLPPPPPRELPLRFLRAGKNDPVEGARRYEESLQWRKEENIDGILREPNQHFKLIKQHYPHFLHLKGRHGEPCFYEQPPKTNLKALREGGVTLQGLLRHYSMMTEYQWQYVIRDDLMSSIYIIDLDGIRLSDFVGEAVDFVKKASKLSALHYPERAGCVFVINVPAWFKIIWRVLEPIIDEATLKKIFVLRGKDEIRQRMQERIPLENIPPEYGGTSMPLGQSPEEIELAELIEHNNNLSNQGLRLCNNCRECKFCTWQPPRSY